MSPIRTLSPRAVLAAGGALLLVALSAPAPTPAQETARGVEELLELKPKNSGALSVPERIALLNVLIGENRFTCARIESDNCERRAIERIEAVLGRDPGGKQTPEQRKARRLLEAWVRDNPERIAWADERTERRARAAAADETAEAVASTRETVTEETSRSSDEDRAEKRSDDDKDMLLALGALGAAIAVGSMLANGDEVVAQDEGRMVVRRDGELLVRRDENELLRRPGAEVTTEAFADGSSRTVVAREDGSQVVTIRDADGYTVRRVRILPDGRRVVLFDDTAPAGMAPPPPPAPNLSARDRAAFDYAGLSDAELERALRRQNSGPGDARYSLRRIREDVRVRDSVPAIDLSITFPTGSAAIQPDQARTLRRLGQAIARIIERDPDEVFLIEGHTDAVGGDAYNLALSDRRAESVALALTEYFGVPPENLVVQGYGERFLKIRTEAAELENRRATVRRITPLLRSAAR